MVVSSLGFLFPYVAQSQSWRSGNRKMPVGMDKQHPRESPISLAKGPEKA